MLSIYKLRLFNANYNLAVKRECKTRARVGKCKINFSERLSFKKDSWIANFFLSLSLEYMNTPTSKNALPDSVYQEINMTATELKQWLKTDESQSVGQASGDGSSIGHQAGEHIVRILHKKKAALTADDEAHLHKVHSYISRHLAQRPTSNVEHTRWRYSLMNWGHDPLKK